MSHTTAHPVSHPLSTLLQPAEPGGAVASACSPGESCHCSTLWPQPTCNTHLSMHGLRAATQQRASRDLSPPWLHEKRKSGPRSAGRRLDATGNSLLTTGSHHSHRWGQRGRGALQRGAASVSERSPDKPSWGSGTLQGTRWGWGGLCLGLGRSMSRSQVQPGHPHPQGCPEGIVLPLQGGAGHGLQRASSVGPQAAVEGLQPCAVGNGCKFPRLLPPTPTTPHPVPKLASLSVGS